MDKQSQRSTHRDLTPPPPDDGRVIWLRGQLLSWFEWCGRNFSWREAGRNAYEVVVAEILLQRTTASAVAQAYTPFLARYPSWIALGRATQEELWEALRPLGLWRQKADVLLSLARTVEEARGAFPTSRRGLEQLKGVGQYTASAVLSAVYGQAEPLVDVNTVRVLGRFFGFRPLPKVGDPHLHALARCLTVGEKSLTVSWAVLDFGALVCRARRPLCQRCPLSGSCASSAGAPSRDIDVLPTDFPFRSRTKEQKQEMTPSAEPASRTWDAHHPHLPGEGDRRNRGP